MSLLSTLLLFSCALLFLISRSNGDKLGTQDSFTSTMIKFYCGPEQSTGSLKPTPRQFRPECSSIYHTSQIEKQYSEDTHPIHQIRHNIDFWMDVNKFQGFIFQKKKELTIYRKAVATIALELQLPTGIDPYYITYCEAVWAHIPPVTPTCVVDQLQCDFLRNWCMIADAHLSYPHRIMRYYELIESDIQFFAALSASSSMMGLLRGFDPINEPAITEPEDLFYYPVGDHPDPIFSSSHIITSTSTGNDDVNEEYNQEVKKGKKNPLLEKFDKKMSHEEFFGTLKMPSIHAKVDKEL